MQKTITVLAGDGVGPEITQQAVLVLEAVGSRFGHDFCFVPADFGGCALDRWGSPLPDETLQACKAADAVLLGAVGGPRWDGADRHLRPEKGLLELRQKMGVFANLRPAKLFPQLAFASPLKNEVLEGGIDLVIVRELTGGIYFGSHETHGQPGQRIATDILVYSEYEIERIIRVAFETAKKRSKRVVSVDKANVLDSSRLWRELAHKIACEYPDVTLTDMLVDNAAMQLVRNPSQFDVLVTENMFGDILSDEASMVVGSIGMMPSASLGQGEAGIYEPIHGSAPELAGKDLANPIGTILSAAMMLRYSFGMEIEAQAVEEAVERALSDGLRTVDIYSKGTTKVGCQEMGKIISCNLTNYR
jgi:3-isopropylmalate dehydrogenase